MGCFPKDDVIAKLDSASFIHPLPESVLSSTEGARPQGALWSHLCFYTDIHPGKIISWLAFQLQIIVCPWTAKLGRCWKLLGDFVTPFFITQLPSQWFKINHGPQRLKAFTVLLPPLSNPQE